MRSEERTPEEYCCEDMRKHLFHRRKRFCSHIAACAKSRAENREKNRDEKGHKDCEKHVRKVM